MSKHTTIHNKKDLQDLIFRLSYNDMTAAEIAYAMGCSREAAYNRLAQLKKLGYKFKKRKAKSFGCTNGPAATAYRLENRYRCKFT